LRNGVSPVRVGDAVAAAAPIGIFFGRVANFINAELWGRPTDVPWAVVFPGTGATCPAEWTGLCARHPSQLYEAGLEGLVLGLVILWAILRLSWLAYPGRIIGLFLAGYGAARMFVERFREADAQFVTPDNPFGLVVRFGETGLSMGQLLSLPMLLAGLALILWSRRRA
jgi:phosphatidylglycerol:prolipoprotein diacylglycerol transferase